MAFFANLVLDRFATLSSHLRSFAFPYENLRAVSMDMVKFEAWSDQFSCAKN
jgi:hypothetical protein